MPSREGRPRKGPLSFARVFPHAQRISGNRQVSWLPGQCLARPSRLHSGHLELCSPVTVAGTAPDLNWLPFSPCFHKAPVTIAAVRGSASVGQAIPFIPAKAGIAVGIFWSSHEDTKARSIILISSVSIKPLALSLSKRVHHMWC